MSVVVDICNGSKSTLSSVRLRGNLPPYIPGKKSVYLITRLTAKLSGRSEQRELRSVEA